MAELNAYELVPPTLSVYSSTISDSPFRLLDLPLELQLKVYFHYFDVEEWDLVVEAPVPTPIPSRKSTHPKALPPPVFSLSRYPPIPLLRVCRAITNRAMSIAQNSQRGYTGRLVISMLPSPYGDKLTQPLSKTYLEPFLRGSRLPQWVRTRSRVIVYPLNSYFWHIERGYWEAPIQLTRDLFPNATTVEVGGNALSGHRGPSTVSPLRRTWFGKTMENEIEAAWPCVREPLQATGLKILRRACVAAPCDRMVYGDPSRSIVRLKDVVTCIENFAVPEGISRHAHILT